MDSLVVWYNLPSEGTPKGFQSHVNINVATSTPLESTMIQFNIKQADKIRVLLERHRSSLESKWQGVSSMVLNGQITHIDQ